MNHFLDSLITTRTRRDTRRDDLCDNFPRGVLKEKQRRVGSLSLQKKSPKRTLIKINKNRFPKDFFPETLAGRRSSLSPQKQGDDTKQSNNDETLDTPNPSSSLINFEESEIFKKTSFFGTENLISQTIPVKEQTRYFSHEKCSVSRDKPKGKLTAIPSMHKSSSHNLQPDEVYNCTFSRDFLSGFQNTIRSIEQQKQRDTSRDRGKQRKYDFANGKISHIKSRKWSEFLNMEFFPEGESITTNEQVNGNFRLKKKLLVASRPASLLPKIYS